MRKLHDDEWYFASLLQCMETEKSEAATSEKEIDPINKSRKLSGTSVDDGGKSAIQSMRKEKPSPATKPEHVNPKNIRESTQPSVTAANSSKIEEDEFQDASDKFPYQNMDRQRQKSDEAFEPQNVMVMKDKNWPSRSIVVSWKPPSHLPTDFQCYECYLCNDEQKKILTRKTKSTTSLSMKFQHLKSDTKYYVCVTTVYGGHKKSSFTPAVITDKVKRSKYDITKHGKPVILKCAAKYEADQIMSDFSWKPADLGNESENFILIETKAAMRESSLMSHWQNLIISDNQRSAIPVPLKWDQKYMFTITCKYKDLDSNESKETCSEQAFDTNIGRAKKLTVTCKEEKIAVRWDAVKGATSYQLQVHNEQSGLVIDKNVKTSTSYDFMMTHDCRYGRICTFTITAIGKNKKSSQSSREELIGGNHVATDCKLAKSSDNPRRKLIAAWKAPKILPGKYLVKLYEIGHDGKPSEIQSDETTGTSLAFKQLKSSTKYHCGITPVYKKATENNMFESMSKLVETDPRRTSSNEIGTNIGIPNIIKCEAIYHTDKILSDFSWKPADLGSESENFILTGTKALLEEGETITKLSLSNDQRSALPIQLLWGRRYTFSVTYTYQDLDSKKKKEAYKKQDLYIDVGKPGDLDLKWMKEEITVSWSTVRGAVSYHLRVENEEAKLVIEKNIRGPTKHQFNMTHNCCYGKICKFTVMATGRNGISKSSSSEQLIGGDYVATDCRLGTSSENPRRELVATWKAPKISPAEYLVKLYEVKLSDDGDTHKMKKEVDSKKAIATNVTFKHLKTSTQYFCEVTPLYKPPLGDCFWPSKSDTAKTERRVESNIESQKYFAMPAEITHVIGEGIDGKIYADLSWDPVILGENFQLLRYHVMVTKKQGFFKKIATLGLAGDEVVLEDVVHEGSKWQVPNLETGNTYHATISTTFRDLDTNKEIQVSKEYKFHTKPQKTTLRNCKWKDGVITFYWSPVNGAKKYKLFVEGEQSREPILEHEIEATGEDDACSYSVQMTEKLCIGRTYRMKVMAFTDGDSSETDWKSQLIGGETVPRNVTANRYPQNPKRTIQLLFDWPLKGVADKYKVVAIPESGKQNTKCFNSNNIEFGYLRTDTKYHFIVHSIYGKTISEGSRSNDVTTDKKDLDQGNPMVGFDDINSPVNMSRSIFSGNTTNLNMTKDKDFGGIRDLDFDFHPAGDEDIAEIKWNVPSFDNNPFDYKVEQYKVKIQKKSGGKSKLITVLFEEGKFEYSAPPELLELGESYEISVTTVYEDIDQDTEHTSSAQKRTKYTRPCCPEILKNDVNNENELEVEWNSAKGAESYRIEVFVIGSDKPMLASKIEKQTTWIRKLDEELGFGISYHVNIIAVGAEGKTNNWKSATKTIGGDYVPTNVLVASNHPKVIDPSTQVFLTWTEPKKCPKSYEVYSEPGTDKLEIKYADTECLVSGLKAGTFYRFKVKAIHDDGNKISRNGGCCSKRIQTNPTPTQVKNVRLSLGENPSTTLQVHWDKVDAEKENESTKYRILMETDDEESGQKREIYSATEPVTVSGLEQNKIYIFSVAGGNSEGYGIYSEKEQIKTAIGTPKDIQLKADEESPADSLLLTFESAEGDPSKYCARLYIYSEQGSKEIIGMTVVSSGHRFSNSILANTIYYAEVCAIYEEDEGNMIQSNYTMTAPSKAEITHAKCSKDGDALSSKEFEIKWKQNPRCNVHEVMIKCGIQLENRLILMDRCGLRYLCQNETSQYFVRVRSKNDSSFYGAWSDTAIINLAAAAIDDVIATLCEDGKICVCWKKSSKSATYYINPICDVEIQHEVISVQTCEDQMIEFQYSPKIAAGKYKFWVWGKSVHDIEGKKVISNEIYSKPLKGANPQVTNSADDSSTCLKIFWSTQERCDTYEVAIRCKDHKEDENISRFTKGNSCTYKCLIPGNTYFVRMRCIRQSACGDWSDKVEVNLAPTQITLIQNDVDDTEPCSSVFIKWEPLSVKPTGYIAILYRGKEKIDQYKGPKTEHKFVSNLKPGHQYHCTVSAHQNDIEGNRIQSRSYKIMWSQPDAVETELDLNHPSQRARIFWDQPYGVNCFKLEIENNMNGKEKTRKVQGPKYIFDTGIPGNTYTIRVYSGYDGIFNIHYTEKKLQMAPDRVQNLTLHVAGGGIAFKWNPPQITPDKYKVDWDANDGDVKVEYTKNCSFVIQDTKPGQLHRARVGAVNSAGCGEMSDYESCSTVPARISWLTSNTEDGHLVFKWEQLEIPPSKYQIEWGCNDSSVRVEFTQQTSFVIRCPKPGHFYRVRVAAVNCAGIGDTTEWETIVSAPNPPYDIRIKPDEENPERTLVVSFKDDFNQLKKYRIVLIADRTGDERVEETDLFQITISDLIPGETYKAKIQTLFCGTESRFAVFMGNPEV